MDLTGDDFTASSTCSDDGGHVWNGWFTGSGSNYAAHAGSVGGKIKGTNTVIEQVGSDWYLRIYCCQSGGNCAHEVWRGRKTGGADPAGTYDVIGAVGKVEGENTDNEDDRLRIQYNTIDVEKVCDCACCCMRLKVTISGFTGQHAWRNGVRIFLLVTQYCYYQWTYNDSENTGGQATIDFSPSVPQWNYYAPPSLNWTTATVAGGCPVPVLTGTAIAGGKDGWATGTITIEYGD
jgi:hypothetical protein